MVIAGDTVAVAVDVVVTKLCNPIRYSAYFANRLGGGGRNRYEALKPEIL